MVDKKQGTRGGFEKYSDNPVLGGDLGVCFDVSVLREENEFKMYFSWRTKKSVALVTGNDGINFGEPKILIDPKPHENHIEDDINRPSVVKTEDGYHMWYTGQHHNGYRDGTSHIFHAFSTDGVNFEREETPVLCADKPWENTSVMNPSVIYDAEEKLFKMWYSAGAQYEPKAIGYAESKDGINFTKYEGNPVHEANPENSWEQHKVAGCQVLKYKGEYLMFYIGYYDEDYAQIGMALSKDGKTDWVRYKNNPIIAPDKGNWDGEACYKPFALPVDDDWYLWYNGRTGENEQIGLVIHKGLNLFDD